MSSALDPSTRESLAAGRRTIGDMLRAAQKDLQKVFIVWLIGFMGTFYALRIWVWDFLKAVTEARMEEATAEQVLIIAQTPFDVILLQVKIGLVIGTLLAIPPFLYFARDALKSRGVWPSRPIPLSKAIPLVTFGTILFTLGVLYGYYVFFPFVFAFLAEHAILSGFEPRYSIVLWTQFIVLLTLSFGIAAQMPLMMATLAYGNIVSYETFRDKWRYAVVFIFAFGALFSPPDPFTQLMWAFPLLALYGVSLYLTKLVVTIQRGSDQVNPRVLLRARWNVLLASALAVGAGVYFFYTRGGVGAVNEAVAGYTRYRLLPPGSWLPLGPDLTALLFAVAWGLFAALVALLLLLLRAAGDDPEELPEIDFDELDADGVRTTSWAQFEALSEEEVLVAANEAMEDDDTEKAQAILDRYDAVHEADEESDTDGAEGAAAGDVDAAAAEDADDAIGEDGTEADGSDLGDRTSRASQSFLEEFREEGADEDDIGGYYYDLRFILDSLTSKSFRIVGAFLLVMSATFAWLYTGGIRDVKEDFLRRLPPEVVPETDEIAIIALHPVEVLIFEIKFSALIGAIAVLPLIGYYAWPGLRDRGFVVGRRRVIYAWVAALVLALLGGFAFGYTFIAPTIISYLVADAVSANMAISYRITNFFWLIFFTTAGVGLLADIPMLMVLLNTAGVPYRAMRSRWREVTVGIMAFSAIFTSASIVTMFLMTIPLMIAYGVGVVALAVLTLGGRRELSEWLGHDEPE